MNENSDIEKINEILVKLIANELKPKVEHKLTPYKQKYPKTVHLRNDVHTYLKKKAKQLDFSMLDFLDGIIRQFAKNQNEEIPKNE